MLLVGEPSDSVSRVRDSGGATLPGSHLYERRTRRGNGIAKKANRGRCPGYSSAARVDFSEWDSNCYFEEDLLALSHLADLAESQSVYDLATVIMDKMFLTMALNSYKGTFGSTHGRTYTPHIKGARGESTAGVSRLMWGMGAFNDKILATVGLACMTELWLSAHHRRYCR